MLNRNWKITGESCNKSIKIFWKTSIQSSRQCKNYSIKSIKQPKDVSFKTLKELQLIMIHHQNKSLGGGRHLLTPEAHCQRHLRINKLRYSSIWYWGYLSKIKLTWRSWLISHRVNKCVTNSFLKFWSWGKWWRHKLEK